MQSYRLTVSIVTYKTPLDFLRKSVADVLSGCDSVYVTIVDNCSGCNYFELLVKEFEDNENVAVLSSGANLGYGFGHNYGVSKSPNSSFHLVMNADVEFEAKALDDMLEFMINRLDVGLAVPKILNLDGSLQALNKRNPTILDMFLRFVAGRLSFIKPIKNRLAYYEMRDAGYDAEVDVPYASGCFMLFRRELFEKVSGFDDDFFMYLEDADITRRIGEISRAVFLPHCEIVHKWSRGSYKNFRLFLVMLHSMGVYFRKWGWKFA